MKKEKRIIILEPLLSEKSHFLAGQNIYFFRVPKRANKKEIKETVEKYFKVKVKKVTIINVKPKKRVRGRIEGYKAGFKKAMVSLKEGKIEIAV